MAFTFGFYNAFEHDRRYDAVQVSKIFDGIIADGVYATVGKAFVLKVNEVTGQVNVQPGRAWFDHTWSLNDADLPLVAPGSDLVNDRWDAVVLDINRSQEPDNIDGRLNKILWIQGIPSSNPEKPTLIKEDEHTQYPLGYIYRKANSLEIFQADIENTVGTSECPFVTGIIETIHIDDLLLQWRDEWVQWLKEKKNEGSQLLNDLINELLNFRNSNEAYFLNWIEEMKDVLSQYPGGEIFLFMQEIRNRQEEIVDMLMHGYIPARLVDKNRSHYILSDLGIPLMLDIPICNCPTNGSSGSSGGGVDSSIYLRLEQLEKTVYDLMDVDVGHDESIATLMETDIRQDGAIGSLEDFAESRETEDIDFTNYFK